MSLVRNFQANVNAKLAIATAAVNGQVAASGTSSHVLAQSLADDMRVLKSIPSHQERDTMKRDTLLPKYLPYVERYLESGEVYQHQVLVTAIVWLFDVGEVGKGLTLALTAIEQGQQSPDFISRDLPTFTAEALLEWAQGQHKQGHSVAPYFDQAFEQVKEWHLYEKITGNYYKLAGLVALGHEQSIAQKTDVEALNTAKPCLWKQSGFMPRPGVKPA